MVEAMEDHLQTARDALQKVLDKLETDARRIRGAIEALSEEGDASAAFRRPGASTGRVSARVREGFTPKPKPVQKQKRYHLSPEEIQRLRQGILDNLKTDEGIKRRVLQGALEQQIDLGDYTLQTSQLLKRLQELEGEGLIRRETPGSQNTTVWFKNIVKSVPVIQGPESAEDSSEPVAEPEAEAIAVS